MIERIIISVLIPALLLFTVQPFGLNIEHSQDMNDAQIQATTARLMQAVLLGTQTDENETVTFSRTAPDEVEGGKTFTISETLTAKVAVEGAAIVSELPEGFALASGNLTGFTGALAVGESYTNTYEVVAPLSPGSYTLHADARAKPEGGESEAIMSSGLSITITEPNEIPIASFVYEPLNAELAPEAPITFNATTSFDLDGEITDYQWNLGDGTTLSGGGRSIVQHTYLEAGTYSVSLTVVDDKGESSLPKISRIQVGEEFRETDNTLLYAIGAAAGVAIVAAILTNTLFGGGSGGQSTAESTTTSTSTTSTTSSTASTTSGNASPATIADKAEGFINQMNLPFAGVQNVRAVENVTESNVATWRDRLENESLVIAMYHSDGLTLVPYVDISREEKIRVDASLSPLGASSVRELIAKRTQPGDQIMQITWEMENGETFQTFAVISPSGIIKYDTFMTLDP